MHNVRMFDWNDLRHLLAVARHGSTLAAAKALHVNQSTVQRRLAVLERALDCSLVERHPRGHRLTEVGQQLRAHAERIELEAMAIARHAASSDKGMVGRIRVTCTTVVGQRLMASGLIEDFNARHPSLTVELIMTERLLSLANGDADLAIRGGDPTDETLVGKKVAEVAWGLYASRAYVQVHGAPASAEELGHHSIVSFVDGMQEHRAARWVRSKAPRTQICAECGNVPSAFLAVKTGACLGPLPTLLADMDDELVRVLGPIPDLKYPVYLLTHRDLRRVPRISAFFDFCAGRLRPVLTETPARSDRTPRRAPASPSCTVSRR
jgi:DNA-binding transcriptional LysR family regulator